jgi:GMP synthase (glutamine-hydrolysing)
LFIRRFTRIISALIWSEFGKTSEDSLGFINLAKQNQHQTIIVLDFGSQYTQLIARRVREAGVYCEILPFNTSAEVVRSRNPLGLILSGSPASVYAPDAPRPDQHLLEAIGCPVLGICYGLQVIAQDLGGEVQPSQSREYGYARLSILEPDSPLFAGLPRELDVWMSHGDHVTTAPPGFVVTARTADALNAFENPGKRIYGLQFHPEVAHTPMGAQVLTNFLMRVCGCEGDWTPVAFINEQIERIRRHVGDEDKVICGISGGVDSAVAAALVGRAIGDRQICVFVNNGLLREGEFELTTAVLKQRMNLNLHAIDSEASFLEALQGITDPEQKRKIIGRIFIEVFEGQAREFGGVKFLVQGTLYPDVIESVSVRGPSAAIKSHHNVGGLPEKMNLQLIEPLRELFKDEVRRIGRELGVPDEVLSRHPFPGPGLAVRIIGDISKANVQLLRAADRIFEEEIRRFDLYDSIWQSFAVLLPISTVGVMGDERTYEKVIALRAITSVDGMTADWARLPHEVLARVSTRIVSEVRGINRVVYDISSKPPSTIEWE